MRAGGTAILVCAGWNSGPPSNLGARRKAETRRKGRDARQPPLGNAVRKQSVAARSLCLHVYCDKWFHS
jgi:hypothetical protein